MSLTSNIVFNKENEEELLKDLNEFGEWLIKKNVINKLSSLDQLIDFPFANSDWVMKVNEKRKTVSFNTQMIETTSLEFYRVVVIHEYFHLIVQRVPHKENVTKIKDTFGAELVKLVDIQADVFTALFLKERKKYDLNSYLKLMFLGRNAFSDAWIRPNKLERFIGSVLSVGRVFLINENNDLRDYYSYLPTISPFYTENCLRLLIFKNEHIVYRDVDIKYEEIGNLKKCYGDNTEIELESYLTILKGFIHSIIDTGVVNRN